MDSELADNNGNMVGNEVPASAQTLRPQRTRASVSNRIVGWFFTPALAPIVQNRWFSVLLAGLAILQIALTAAGLRVWQCSIRFISGLPCPGCGLSTAIVLFIQGKWPSAIYAHGFAPVFLVAIILLAISGSMPSRLRQNVALRLAVLERRTGIVPVVVMVMFIYWGLRLCGMVAVVPEY